MTFTEYLVNVSKRIYRDRDVTRIGQAYSNELSLVRPNLFDLVMSLSRGGANVDPFYTNDNLPAFLEFVERNW